METDRVDCQVLLLKISPQLCSRVPLLASEQPHSLVLKSLPRPWELVKQLSLLPETTIASELHLQVRGPWNQLHNFQPHQKEAPI